MTEQILQLNASNPIVGKTLTMEQQFRTRINAIISCVNALNTQVGLLTPVISTGSPEGVESAMAGQVYIDSAAVSPSRRYTKMVDDVAADTTLGWVLD